MSAIKATWMCCWAVLLNKLRPAIAPCVILGSNYGGRADYNLIAFCDYLDSQGISAYVVSAAPIARLSKHQHQWLKRGSFRAARMYYASDAAFFTHSLSDIVPQLHRLWVLDKLFKHPMRCFLQHGLIGITRDQSAGKTLQAYLHSISKTFEVMIVSAQWERRVVAGLGVPDSKMLVSGIPRLDYYLSARFKVTKQVLVFLTWQSADDYFAKLQRLRESKAIINLKQRGYAVQIAYHDMMRQAGAEKLDLQSMIHQSEMLITDNSSMAWDFIFSGREVFFYQPSNSWFVDFSALQARRCDNLSELQQRIDEYLGAYLAPIDASQMFAYRDGRNSARIADYCLNNEHV